MSSIVLRKVKYSFIRVPSFCFVLLSGLTSFDSVGEPLDLGDAIRLFHDSLDYPYVNNTGAAEEFYLLTKPEYSGPAPTREPPPVPATAPSPVVIPPPVVESEPVTVSSPVTATNLTKSQSFDSPSEKELTIDDIEDFEDDEDEFDSRRASRRHQTDASDLSLRLPLFETGITDDDLRETAYEILVAAAGASGYSCASLCTHTFFPFTHLPGV